MDLQAAYRVLGLKPGAKKDDIKRAYRRLAKEYHPDLNNSPGAEKKFLDISTAFNILTEHATFPTDEQESYRVSEEILRRQRQQAAARARQKARQKREEELRFRESGAFDLLLLARYIFRALLILISIAAIILPFALWYFFEPMAALATSYMTLVGIFGLGYIIKRREKWFRLGNFYYTFKKLRSLLARPKPHPAKDFCCYTGNTPADGKPYRIRLVRITSISYSSRGALDHQSTIRSKAMDLVIPRSSRAEFFHRITSLIKIITIVVFLVLFPVSSVIWRLIAGITSAAFFSVLFLKITGIRSHASYLLTPSLLIKLAVWVAALLAISEYGPGFEIRLGEYKFIVIAGLIFLTDILFDLIFGLLPFYQKLFIPVTRQGKTLEKLYREGFINYIDYPVVSILYPFYKWVL